MNTLRTGAALLLPMLLLPLSAQAACEDLQVNLGGIPQDATLQNQATQKASIFLRCMGNTRALPGTTLMQTVREEEGKMCYSDLACGNVNSWSGYIALSGTWIFYDSVFSFLQSQEGEQAVISGRNDYHGRNTGVNVSLEWGQIMRDCKPVSPEICL